MVSTSSDWDEATFSDEIYIKDAKKNKQENRTILYNIFINIIKLFKNIRSCDIENIYIANLDSESVAINKLSIIKKYVNENETDNTLQHILAYKLLTKYGIASRLLSSLSPDGLSIVELHTDLEIIKYTKKYKDIVFTLDSNFTMVNLGIIYSKGLIYYKPFESILKEICQSKIIYYMKNILTKNLGIKSLPDTTCFDTENQRKLLSNPKSIQSFRKHPLYVIESVLNDSQCIHPKRPIEGYFKGEPIYPRKNVVKLKTERTLYLNGKKVTSDKPYRKIYRNDECKLLYAPWQAEDIVVKGFANKRYMDYFHVNHIPIDCTYIDHAYAALLANELKMKYKECVVGFKKKQIVISGIFIERMDELFFRHALFEYIQKNKINAANESFESCILLWKRLSKKVSRYKKIIERVG